MLEKILNRISPSFVNKISIILCEIKSVVIDIKTALNSFINFFKEKLEDKETNTELICSYEEFDDTKMYRGYSVKINNYITIRQPSLDEITKFGDNKYYGMVHHLCSVGADLKWQLDNINVDYTTIDDFTLFNSILHKSFDVESTKILFGDKIDFTKMTLMFNQTIQEPVLIYFFDEENYLQIDRYVYASMVDVLRKMHRLKRNDEVPGNEATRQVLIEDAREEYELNKDKPIKPYLLPLISAMVNSEGFKRNEITVFEMKICAFMDSVARIGKIKNSELLLQSGYSGFGIDLKKLNKEDTNWLGEL